MSYDRGPYAPTRVYRFESSDPRWHDKSISRGFKCEHCGAHGFTGEADARCEECGRTTYLPIEERVRILPRDKRGEARRKIMDEQTVADLREIGRRYGISYERGSSKSEMVDQLIRQDPNVALGLYERGHAPY